MEQADCKFSTAVGDYGYRIRLLSDRQGRHVMYRQGDILLLPADKHVNVGNNPRRSDIVARGEATGHAHRIVGDGWVANDSVVVVGPRGATLAHDEHAPIQLREGVYAIRRQREFEDNGWREVYD